MSRPIGRTKIRVDWSNVTDKTALTQRLLSNFSDEQIMPISQALKPRSRGQKKTDQEGYSPLRLSASIDIIVSLSGV